MGIYNYKSFHTSSRTINYDSHLKDEGKGSDLLKVNQQDRMQIQIYLALKLLLFITLSNLRPNHTSLYICLVTIKKGPPEYKIHLKSGSDVTRNGERGSVPPPKQPIRWEEREECII